MIPRKKEPISVKTSFRDKKSSIKDEVASGLKDKSPARDNMSSRVDRRTSYLGKAGRDIWAVDVQSPCVNAISPGLKSPSPALKSPSPALTKSKSYQLHKNGQKTETKTPAKKASTKILHTDGLKYDLKHNVSSVSPMPRKSRKINIADFGYDDDTLSQARNSVDRLMGAGKSVKEIDLEVWRARQQKLKKESEEHHRQIKLRNEKLAQESNNDLAGQEQQPKGVEEEKEQDLEGSL